MKYNTIAVLQDGQVKSSFEPGSSIRLWADLKEWGVFTFHTEYVVKDYTGNIILKEYVSINVVNGQSYLDWAAPANEGTYTFYPDTADSSNYKTFKVKTESSNGNDEGEEDGSGSEGLFGLDTKTLLILGGIAAAALLIGSRR